MTVVALAGLPRQAETAAPPGPDGELRSVTIAVRVLDCFAGSGELGPTQVARQLGVAKSTASRMLSALAAGGLLERSGAGRYRLGLRLFHYGQLAVDRLPLRAVARPVLADLHVSLRETVQLGLPVDGHVLYVERMGSAGLGARLPGDVLLRVPGYSSSAGRVMAAFDPEVAAATGAVERLKHTAFTITDEPGLERMLEAGRDRGWVASREEYAGGCSSLAAPVLVSGPAGSRAVAAVSVVGPTSRILGVGMDFVAASVCRAARRISSTLSRMEECG